MSCKRAVVSQQHFDTRRELYSSLAPVQYNRGHSPMCIAHNTRIQTTLCLYNVWTKTPERMAETFGNSAYNARRDPRGRPSRVRTYVYMYTQKFALGRFTGAAVVELRYGRFRAVYTRAYIRAEFSRRCARERERAG